MSKQMICVNIVLVTEDGGQKTLHQYKARARDVLLPRVGETLTVTPDDDFRKSSNLQVLNVYHQVGIESAYLENQSGSRVTTHTVDILCGAL